jgi:hypothetical protein
MARGSVTTLRRAAAAAAAKDIEAIAAAINAEICALRCAHETLDEAVNSGDLQRLSEGRNLVRQSIRRFEQLHDALERSDLSVRLAHGAAALSAAEAAEYRGPTH